MICVQNVVVEYGQPGKPPKRILNGVNLDIHPGEFISIVGQTGCGKSTLLRLVLAEEMPTRGQVLVEGNPRKQPDRRCGYVPQKYSLFPDRTMMQNVMYGPENAFCGWFGRLLPSFRRFKRELRAEAEEQLLRMGLRSGDFHKYPHQLSGGMQQRVAIAQALMMRPPVLLMDEAFSALDPATRASLQEQLRAIWQETRPTVLFVTHNTAEALLLGSRLLVLKPHCEGSGESNVLLDMPLPQSGGTIAEREQSREFLELREYVKHMAYGSSPRQTEEAMEQETDESGDSL